MSTDPETRRAIAQRAIERAKAHGMPIDEDPVFIALLDAWISGDIDMHTVRERYIDSRAFKDDQRHDGQSNQVGTSRNDEVKKKGPTELTAAHKVWRF